MREITFFSIFLAHLKKSSGYSIRNLKYMRQFAEEYPDFPFVQVPLAQLQELPILAAKSRANKIICTFLAQNLLMSEKVLTLQPN